MEQWQEKGQSKENAEEDPVVRAWARAQRLAREQRDMDPWQNGYKTH